MAYYNTTDRHRCEVHDCGGGDIVVRLRIVFVIGVAYVRILGIKMGKNGLLVHPKFFPFMGVIGMS